MDEGQHIATGEGGWNYDGDEFYRVIEGLGRLHADERDMAVVLGLPARAFKAMKAGNYAPWTAEENLRRGERIRQVLAHSHTEFYMSLMGAYYRLAMGQAKKVTVRYAYTPCDACRGEDAQCPKCGGTGRVPDGKRRVEEVTLPPSLEALEGLLAHYHPDWKQSHDEEAPQGALRRGVRIEEWIEAHIIEDKEEGHD